MWRSGCRPPGASILRGGAFKPRTSPYSFQGLRAEGLELLQEARAVTGQPIVTELMNNEHIPLVSGRQGRYDPDRRAQHAEL